MLQMTAHYSVANDIRLRKEGFGAIIFRRSDWATFVINVTGYTILTLLTQENLTLKEVEDLLTYTYPESKDLIPASLRKYVTRLLKLGILETKEK